MERQSSTSGAHATAELIAWDKAHVWHPFTPMKAWVERDDLLVIERAEGMYLIDTEGRRYLDGVSSLWCNVHGHRVKELDEAVIGQLGKVAHSTLLGLANVPSAVLARRLVEIAPAGLVKVFYSDDGSTAVEVACKMAYQYWRNKGVDGRTRFLAFEDAYHGDTVGAVSVGGIPMFHATFKGLTFAVDFVGKEERHNAECGMRNAERIGRVEAMLRANRGMYAGIVVEPMVQGAGGMILHPPGFLRELRRLADEHDVLLIADEVMTGFGRTGKMFACEHEGVTPDLLCLSKGLTGGYMPLGVTMTTQKIYDAFYADPREGKTFFHGHTFTGHPLACAVAIASLDLFVKNDLMKHVERMSAVMAEELGGLRGRMYVRDVRQIGLVAGVELGDEDGGSFDYQWRVGGAVCLKMRERGVFLRPLGDVLVVMPPLAISEEELRRLCRVVVESVGWVGEVVLRSKEQEARSKKV